MAKLRVHSLAVSLDGYAAGPNQGLEDPMGRGGEQLHEWAFKTATFRRMGDDDGGSTGVDDSFAARGVDGIGATIMGRNMFGPIRDEWPDETWTGWWGEEPPYHHPVFVLTHHPRRPIPMAGGTTFHFVTDGIDAALRQATDAAGGLDVRLGGGTSTVRQYLDAGLIDELQFDIVPVLLGSGERLFGDLPTLTERYECSEFVGTDDALHITCTRRPGA